MLHKIVALITSFRSLFADVARTSQEEDNDTGPQMYIWVSNMLIQVFTDNQRAMEIVYLPDGSLMSGSGPMMCLRNMVCAWLADLVTLSSVF